MLPGLSRDSFLLSGFLTIYNQSLEFIVQTQLLNYVLLKNSKLQDKISDNTRFIRLLLLTLKTFDITCIWHVWKCFLLILIYANSSYIHDFRQSILFVAYWRFIYSVLKLFVLISKSNKRIAVAYIINISISFAAYAKSKPHPII